MIRSNARSPQACGDAHSVDQTCRSQQLNQRSR